MLLIVLHTPPVFAGDHAATHHAASSDNVIAARFVGGAVAEEGATATLSGGGLAAEHVFGNGNALEVTASALQGEEGTEVPVEILLEHTWHASERFEPFAGVGPAVVVHSLDGEREVSFGAVGAVGTHVWLGEHWGLLAEVDLTLDAREEMAMGSEVLVGPVFHWQ